MKLHFPNTTLILVFVLLASFLSVAFVSVDLGGAIDFGLGKKAPQSRGGCVPAGCSGQLCVDASEADGIVTTCEYSASYACYNAAVCEKQAGGECGWTMTEELQSCLQESESKA